MTHIRDIGALLTGNELEDMKKLFGMRHMDLDEVPLSEWLAKYRGYNDRDKKIAEENLTLIDHLEKKLENLLAEEQKSQT